jgi:hypothetical protein
MPPPDPERKHDPPTRRERIISAVRRTVEWADRKLPRGVRSVLGLLLIAAGIFGFLPILGFWMIPLGISLIALDIPPLRRRLFDWLERHRTDQLH